MTSPIDETLLAPRQVLRSVAEDDGLGFICDLACGHSVWIAVQPPDSILCSLCLNQLIEQARQVQAHQEPRGRELSYGSNRR